MTNPSSNMTLLKAVAEYWRGYSTTQERDTATLREWSSDTLSRNMLERAIKLCDAFAVHSGDSNRGHLAAGHIAQSVGAVYTIEQRRWYGVRLAFIGANTLERNLPPAFKEKVWEMARVSLTVCILPSSYVEEWQDFVTEIRSQDGFVLPVFPADLNALASGNWSLLDLVEYKFYRIFLLSKLDVETQFGELVFAEFERTFGAAQPSPFVTLDEAVARVDDSPAQWAEHPKLDRLVDVLEEEQDCLLVGPSASGKTTLAFQAGLKLAARGLQTQFADLGVLSPTVASGALRHFLNLNNQNKDTLLIVDDLQSNPSVARILFMMRRLVKNAGVHDRLRMLAITWPSFVDQASIDYPSALRLSLKPADAQHALLSKYGSSKTAADVAAMAEIAEDDVLVWRLLLESDLTKPSKETLARRIWNEKSANYHGSVTAAKRVALVAAMLGQYEFDVSEGFLRFQAGVNHQQIERMVQAKLLRQSMNKLVLGHRSICAILAEWLLDDTEVVAYLKRINRPSEPVDVVNAYIRTADVSETWGILKTLHAQVGFKGGPATSYKAQVLADAWQSIDSLIERIEQQQKIDPTWGNVLSSVVFAIEALSAVGKHELARSSIDYMRSYWTLSNGRIEVKSGTGERGDFDQIQKRMKTEDEVIDPKSQNYEAADEVDLDKFHSTWVQGLILCAEHAYGERDYKQLEELASIVEQLQEPEGYFYPRRVPWCTTRVLMGLARAGRTTDNSEVVRKTCDWLLRSVDEGGVYRDGVWESGTGTWNTTLETTAMSIIALVEAGVSTTNPKLVDAWNYIVSLKGEWTRQGREIDGANALIAYLKVIGNWQDVIPEVQYLLRWARGEAFWDSAGKSADELLDQTCKVAVIADYLIEASWASLRNDLPEFLNAFAVPETADENWTGFGSRATDDYRSSREPEKEPKGPVAQHRSRIVSAIELDYREIVSRLREQLDELTTYEDRIRSSGGQDLKLKQLNDRRATIRDQINHFDDQRSQFLKKVQSATTDTELDEIHHEWRGTIEGD